jgi:thiol-disulfide isomerase/thioredoxin
MIFFQIILLIVGLQNSEPAIHFFYRPSCGHCMDILLGDIPKLQAKYAFRLKKYDIDFLDNYRLMEKMEQTHGTMGEDLPVIFMGDSVFYGPDGLYARLEGILRAFPRRRHMEPRDIETVHPYTVPAIAEKILVLYFFQPGCRECSRLDALFDNLEQEFENISVSRRSLIEDTNKVMLEALSEKISMPENERLLVPVVIIGQGYLIKGEITTDNLYGLMQEHHPGDQIIEEIDVLGAENSILQRFGQFSLLGIIIAGLLDGVNPCAFATIIFFVSYLLFLGRRRRDIVLMAVAFISAVFIAYFLIGVGAYNLLKYLVGYEIIAKIVFLSFGIIAIVLGLLSLRDYGYARKGKFDKMLLQLPLGIKQRIHRDIKKKTAVRGIIIGSFLTGLVISFLEFGCTGQIYLPTIMFMISKVGWRLKPILSLLVYNVMFVVPLIAIALLAVAFTTKRMTESLSSKIPLIKLLTALLFFALGFLLIISA